MAQQTINDNEGGGSVRGKLNGMFSELYSSTLVPMKLIGAAGNVIQTITGNTFVASIEVTKVSGTPILKIGTTPAGEEIFAETEIGTFNMATVQNYFAAETPLYFTLSGGVINARTDIINNYF